MGAIQLSLAHFCENDGPTSIFCTQARPISCRTCWGPRSIESSLGDLQLAGKDEKSSTEKQPMKEGSSTGSSVASSPGIAAQNRRQYKSFTGGGRCTSCSVSISQETAAQLPPGSPGSPKADGTGTNGSPIWRSEQKYLVLDPDPDDGYSFHQSSPISATSSTTTTSSSHEHLFYSSTTSDAVHLGDFARIQKTCVRTLMSETLPPGVLSGGLSFEDPVDGLTIAWKFTLPDPHARGSKRHYALLAVLGPDSSAGMQAAPMVWSTFEYIATKLGRAAAAGGARDGGQGLSGGKPRRNVASFLTGSSVDPDGHPRGNAIQLGPRSLASIVGDENIFAWLHRQFSLLLNSLRIRFGDVLTEPQD